MAKSLLEQTYQSILDFVNKVEVTPGANENPALRASLHSLKGRARLLETQLYGTTRSAKAATTNGLFSNRPAAAPAQTTTETPPQETGHTAAAAA